jgi:hypothetical protein
MPEESRSDAVEKFLTEQKSMEERKQALIDDVLKQREAAIKAFDEKLEKLGYRANSGKGRRSHHRKGAPASAAVEVGAKPAGKPKA